MCIRDRNILADNVQRLIVIAAVLHAPEHFFRLLALAILAEQFACTAQNREKMCIRDSRKPLPGLIFHSDRGVQYAAYAYRQRLASLGIRQSMSRKGDP